MRAFLRGATASAAETSSSSSSSSSSASSAKDSSNSSLANVFLRPPTARSRAPLSLRVATTESTLTFWETTVLPACKRWGIHPAGLRLACCGHMIPVNAHTTLSALGVSHLSTVDVVGQLPSQGFAQLHQLVEHLHEMLAPVGFANTSPPAVEESSSSREPIMHAIDAEIKRGSSSRADAQRFCSCLSCTRRPNSTLWLCGALLHSTDAAVVNITFRVVQLMLHASVDCPAPLVYFDEESGAITLGAREAEYGHVFEAVQEALTPEGVAIASLLSQRLVMLPLTPHCRVSRLSPAVPSSPLTWRDLRASPLHALTGISPPEFSRRRRRRRTTRRRIRSCGSIRPRSRPSSNSRHARAGPLCFGRCFLRSICRASRVAVPSQRVRAAPPSSLVPICPATQHASPSAPSPRPALRKLPSPAFRLCHRCRRRHRRPLCHGADALADALSPPSRCSQSRWRGTKRLCRWLLTGGTSCSACCCRRG